MLFATKTFKFIIAQPHAAEIEKGMYVCIPSSFHGSLSQERKIQIWISTFVIPFHPSLYPNILLDPIVFCFI